MMKTESTNHSKTLGTVKHAKAYGRLIKYNFEGSDGVDLEQFKKCTRQGRMLPYSHEVLK